MAATTPPQPVALAHGVKRPRAGTVANSTEQNLTYGNQVHGYHVGAMAIEEFRLQYTGVKTEKPTPKVNWSSVLEATVEIEMYKPFVIAALNDGLLRKDIEIFVSADRSSPTCHLRPDIGIRILGDDTPSRQWNDRDLVITEAFDFATTSLAIEFKLKADADPFRDNFNHPKKPFERIADPARKVRGQLAKYADGQFSHQHRCFVWQVLICGNIARILRWDHSGALVSEAFDYVKTDRLAEFLWSFYHMTPKLQGWDDSVSLVRDVAQKGLLYDAIKALVSDSKIRKGDNLAWAAAALDPDFPVHKVEVKDKYTCQTYYFLLGRAFDVDVGPIGRGTRWFIAYDLKHGQLKMLKDSWRVENAIVMQEMDACSLLKHVGASNILEPTCRGDVMVFGAAQRTTVHEFATKPLPWRAPCKPIFGMFRHCRTAEDVGYPMNCLRSSRQAVTVVRDIVKAINDAYMGSAGLFHRNVNVKNIMFVFSNDAESGIKGVLTGWDHSVLITKLASAQSPFHNLTPQCTSISLLEDHEKLHELIDDLESVFWALAWFGIHHVSHPNRTILLKSDPFSTDLEASEKETENVTAGKRSLLRSKNMLRKFPYVSGGYRDLLDYLLAAFDTYYRFRGLQEEGETGNAQYQEQQRQLSDPDWWLKTLQRFLDTGEWAENDIVNDMFPPISTVRKRGKMEALASSQFGTSHIDKSTGRPRTTLGSLGKTAINPSTPSPNVSLLTPAIEKTLNPIENLSLTKSDFPTTTSGMRTKHGRDATKVIGSDLIKNTPGLDSTKSDSSTATSGMRIKHGRDDTKVIENDQTKNTSGLDSTKSDYSTTTTGMRIKHGRNAAKVDENNLAENASSVGSTKSDSSTTTASMRMKHGRNATRVDENNQTENSFSLGSTKSNSSTVTMGTRMRHGRNAKKTTANDLNGNPSSLGSNKPISSVKATHMRQKRGRKVTKVAKNDSIEEQVDTRLTKKPRRK